MPELTFNNGKWKIHEDFYVNGITVPKDFETDLASIPRILWGIYPPFGKYQTGAIVHDYLYTSKSVDRKEADYIFLVIMKNDGVNIFTRKIFYLTVRLFGGINY